MLAFTIGGGASGSSACARCRKDALGTATVPQLFEIGDRLERKKPAVACGLSSSALCRSALVDRHVVADRSARIELARTADLLRRILDHFLPLGDPAHGAG